MSDQLFGKVSIAIALGLVAPSAARAYENEHLFVANRGAGNIVELKEENLELVRTWFDDRGLDGPNGIAFTPGGDLYLADTYNSRVIAFDPTGALRFEIPVGDAIGNHVESLNFDATNRLYLTGNPGNGAVPRYSYDGTFQTNVVNDPSYVNLSNINLTVAGHLIISDFSHSNRGIREHDQETFELLRTFGTDVGRMEDMAVDGADRIFVSAYDSNEVVVYGPDRVEERRFGSADGIVNPTGIAITVHCRVLVSSFGTNEIFVFEHDGTFVQKATVEGLTQPESIGIAGVGVPGAQAEFLQFVPRCDGTDPVGVDGGVSVEVDGGVAGDGSVPDAGDPLDAGAGDDGAIASGAGVDDGCDCATAGRSSHSAFGVFLSALFAAVLLRSRRR